MKTHPYFETTKNHFETFDFSKLDLKELEASVMVALENGRHAIKKIVKSTEAPNFQNTLLKMEEADENLDTVLNVLFALFSAHTSDEVQALVEKLSPLLSQYSNEILFDEKVFSRVQAVFEKKEDLNLNEEQLMLLDKTYKSFTKNGANLDSSQKEKLMKIDAKLSELTPQFSKNVLSATNAFEWTTQNLDDLKGLPSSAIETAKEEAQRKELPEGTYLFSLHHPSLLPILKYNENRSIREKFFKASSSKATVGEFSNQDKILEIVQLRDEKAKILGFSTYADFVLQDRMAKNSQTVFDFINDIKKYSLEPAKKEMQELKDFALSLDGLSELKAWDVSFYAEKLRQKKYDISDEETKPYFPLKSVLEGAFEHAKRLYGLDFKENSQISKYQEDVQTFEVWDENKNFIGVFYTDFFPRASKKPGAWCTHFRPQGLFKGEAKRPHVSIVCNFTKPTQSTPSLLTYDEVRTLFHEFGHALHELLSQCTYRSLSGTSVYWDFVELPSQIMENWTLEEESLSLFAKHYQTGEVLPKDLIEKLKKASTFMAGYACIRQIRFATLDMLWHTTPPEDISSVLNFEEQATQDLNLLEKVEGALASCAFSHIFAGGYAAGYYSYKWAEVLDADAFELFQEKGVFNKEVAQSFKTHILEKGGTKHPEELYVNFRGRKPDVKALLRRDQLI